MINGSDATPRPSLPPFHTDGRCLKAPSGFRDFSSFRPRRGRAQPLAGITRRVLLTFPFPMPRLRWRAPTYDTRLTTRSFFYQQLHLDKAESKAKTPARSQATAGGPLRSLTSRPGQKGRANSWAFRLVADAKRSATGNCQVVSCWYTPSRQVDDNSKCGTPSRSAQAGRAEVIRRRADARCRPFFRPPPFAVTNGGESITRRHNRGQSLRPPS